MHTIQRPDPWHTNTIVLSTCSLRIIMTMADAAENTHCPRAFLWRMKRVLGRRTERRKRHPTSTVCYAPYHTNSMYVLCTYYVVMSTLLLHIASAQMRHEYVPRVHLLNHIYLQGYTYYIVVFYSTSAHVE